MKIAATFLLLTVLASSAYGFQMKAMQMREDYGVEPLSDCYMNYYYTIPCPTSSWFWMFSGVTSVPGDMIGVFFKVGDMSMSQADCSQLSSCDPLNDCTIEQFRVLDFAGYGTVYPGLFTVVYDIWCADEQGCPIAPPLWTSGPIDHCTVGWNYITVSPPLCITECHTQPGPPYGYPRFLITATGAGSSGAYPAWGMDNISAPISQGCTMHDTGCCPALYPRPGVGHYDTMHSGYYGNPSQGYCPPVWFIDGADTTDGATVYGYIELAWRVYLIKSGPTAVEPSSWGNIKAIYR